jgi:hypothetical protein
MWRLPLEDDATTLDFIEINTGRIAGYATPPT